MSNVARYLWFQAMDVDGDLPEVGGLSSIPAPLLSSLPPPPQADRQGPQVEYGSEEWHRSVPQVKQCRNDGCNELMVIMLVTSCPRSLIEFHDLSFAIFVHVCKCLERSLLFLPELFLSLAETLFSLSASAFLFTLSLSPLPNLRSPSPLCTVLIDYIILSDRSG